MSEVCNGSSPWKCPANEVGPALELARLGLLPVGPDANIVNVIELLASIQSGEITPEEVKNLYQVNGIKNTQSY